MEFAQKISDYDGSIMTLQGTDRDLKTMILDLTTQYDSWKLDEHKLWKQQNAWNQDIYDTQQSMLKVEDFIGTEGAPYETYADFVRTMTKYVNPRLNKKDEMTESKI